METICIPLPVNKRGSCRNPLLQDLETFIRPLQRQRKSVKGFPKKSCKSRRFLDLLRRPQQQQQLESDDEEFIQTPRSTLRQSFRSQQWGQQEQHQPRVWSTVVPLHVPVRPEEVRVKLNPICHMLVIKATPLMMRNKNQFRGINNTQQIHRLVTLPKTIRMEKIQVKLNPRGELVIMAPYKSQQQMQGRHSMLPPFFQEEERDTQQWITIPINKLQQGGIPNKSFYPGFQYGEELSETSSSSSSSSSSESETETETDSEDERLNFPFSSETESETETETESETESESEMFQGRHQNTIMEQLKRIDIRTSIKIQVQKFVQLLEKVFYPNIVMVKLVRGSSTQQRYQQQQNKKQLQVVVSIKFTDFKSEEIKVRMHQTQSVLIVEGKKVRQMSQFGGALKYVRREIQLPQIFNVKKMVYRVLENGLIRINLPFLTTITGQQHQQQQEVMQNFISRRERCPHSMVNLISEPEMVRGRRCQDNKRNWKVLTQRCRPISTRRRFY